MSIIAKANLTLKRSVNDITLYYDTYEKAPYDYYLIAALIKNSKDEEESLRYIDEISGKGSLNAHFKRLYEMIKQLDDDQIDTIIDNSLYPVTKIVEDSFLYYPDLDLSLFHNNSYEGDIGKDERDLALKMLPKESNGEYRKIAIHHGEIKERDETHNISFSDESISINMGDNSYHPISKEVFHECYKNAFTDDDFRNIGMTLSEVRQKASYMLLGKETLSLALSNAMNFVGPVGSLIKINPDCFAEIEIIKVSGVYFYSEMRREFTDNRHISDEALFYLLKSGHLNNVKTKTLIAIMNASTDTVSQLIINYVLTRKDSKEIAESALQLMKQGLLKGYEKETLLSIKKSLGANACRYIYKCDPSLPYSVSELLNVDKDDLTEEHKAMVDEYTKERDNTIKEINSMIGEMASSGVRERMKGLTQKDSNFDALKQFYNKKLAHVKGDTKSMNDGQLKALYNEILSTYEGAYQKILGRIEKEGL